MHTQSVADRTEKAVLEQHNVHQERDSEYRELTLDNNNNNNNDYKHIVIRSLSQSSVGKYLFTTNLYLWLCFENIRYGVRTIS